MDPRVDSGNPKLGNSGSSAIAGTPSTGLGTTGTAGGLGTSNTSGISSGTGQGSQSSRENERNFSSDSGYAGSGSGLTGTNQSSGQHLGRDAGVVGTPGGVGEGNLGSSTTQTGQGLTGQTLPFRSGSGVTGSNQVSSLGRDATAIGGVSSDMDSFLQYTGLHIEQPHTTSVANRLDPSVNTQDISNVGLEDSHHHSSVHGGGAEEADRHHGSAPSSPVGVASTPAYNSPSGHHLGGDAGVAGGVGGAAYEAEKHHNSHETGTGTSNGLPTASGNHGIGTGTGTGNAVAGETGRQGLGHGATPLDEKTRGSDLGDKLHGADRNRGVAGSSGFPSTEGYGSGTSGTVGKMIFPAIELVAKN